MRQRIITVPINSVVEKALNLNEASTDQLIELKISEDEFLFLFQNEIIKLINREGRTNIDDFEDDSIIGKKNINKVIKVLELKKMDFSDLNHIVLLENIIKLFKDAFNRNTGVYFYF